MALPVAVPVFAAMPPAPEIIVPALDNLYGAYLLGTCVSIILYGLSLHQLYRYIRLYSSDPASIKSLVALVMTLQTMHVALLMHTCYYYLVSNYNDLTLQKITHSVVSLQLEPLLASLITVASQVFFTRRVSLIGCWHKLLVGVVATILLAHVGFGLAITANAFVLNSLSGFQKGGDWLFPATIGSAAVADLLLSSAIIDAIRRSRRNNQRGKTAPENPFDVWVLYVLNSGFLTCIVNVLPTIAAIIWPQTFIWAGLSFVGTRFYAITLLAVLNSRKLAINRGMEIFDVTTYGRNIIARANHLAAVERWGAPQVPDGSPPKIDIRVSAEIEVHKQTEDGQHTFDTKGYDGRSF